jgi:hypothetical protein
VRKKVEKLAKYLSKYARLNTHVPASLTINIFHAIIYIHSCVLIRCRGVRSRCIGSRSVRCGSRDIRSGFGSNIGRGSDIGSGCRGRVGCGCRGRVGRGRGIGLLEKGLVRAGLALVLNIGVVLLVLVHIVVHNLQPAVRQLNLKNPGVKVSECYVLQVENRQNKSGALRTRKKVLENSVIKVQI